MSLFHRLNKAINRAILGKTKTPPAVRNPKSAIRNRIVFPGGRARSYDAAATGRHFDTHFVEADSKDAQSLISADLPTLRNRARYEIRNNAYAQGIVQTFANDVVGTGPSLQVKTGDDKLNTKIENDFREWSELCDRAGRLSFAAMARLAIMQLMESGECLRLFQSDDASSIPVHLRLLMIEPDRLSSPWMASAEKVRDGIEMDDYGKPINYYILTKHPGSTYNMKPDDQEAIAADQVTHLFRVDRPGQIRGVPWITPSIPLFAQLRRYTLAVIDAAETAAGISAVMETDSPDAGAADVESMDEIELARNAMLTLPGGWKAHGFSAEQPPTTYKMFKAEILNEIARPFNMPFNVAAANSSGYNYASGRLDWQVYFRAIVVIQSWLGLHFGDSAFFAWLREASLIPGYLPSRQRLDRRNVTTEWFWTKKPHVDPIKEANAQHIRLKSLTTTLAEEYAQQGKDWERQVEQIARERKKLAELNLSIEDVASGAKRSYEDDSDE